MEQFSYVQFAEKQLNNLGHEQLLTHYTQRKNSSNLFAIVTTEICEAKEKHIKMALRITTLKQI